MLKLPKQKQNQKEHQRHPLKNLWSSLLTINIHKHHQVVTKGDITLRNFFINQWPHFEKHDKISVPKNFQKIQKISTLPS